MTETVGADVVPLVEYFVLGPSPHLIVRECSGCGAHFFDRRSDCAACGGRLLRDTKVPTTGTLRTYTIVSVGPSNVSTPYIAAIIDCGGILVRANIVGIDPEPSRLVRGLPVRLCTVPFGPDAQGIVAMGFAFEPDEERHP
jgi:uncharacterized OB-fold protein